MHETLNLESRLTVDFLSVTLHCVELTESTNIEKLDLTVATSSSYQMTIWTPLGRVDSLLMRVSGVSSADGCRRDSEGHLQCAQLFA